MGDRLSRLHLAIVLCLTIKGAGKGALIVHCSKPMQVCSVRVETAELANHQNRVIVELCMM